MATIVGKGPALIECVPVVYDELTMCGIAVYFKDGTCQAWGPAFPRDLIASWRATEILCHIDSIEEGTLAAAYYAGMRAPTRDERRSYVNPMIARIGPATHRAIMNAPVPEVIVRAILDNQKNDFPPMVIFISDEVRAGTIMWRQEFADVGIKHPKEADAEESRKDREVQKFEKLLISFASFRKFSRHCAGMNYVEGALLALIAKGAQKNNSDRVLVALAGVVGSSGLAEVIVKTGTILEEQKQKAIERSASWLSQYYDNSWSGFWRWLIGLIGDGGDKFYNYEEARDLLEKLFEEYFPKPVEKEKVIP